MGIWSKHIYLSQSSSSSYAIRLFKINSTIKEVCYCETWKYVRTEEKLRGNGKKSNPATKGHLNEDIKGFETLKVLKPN